MNAPIRSFTGTPYIFSDSYTNLLAGLGIFGRDKAMSQVPTLNLLTYDLQSLENYYRGDWLARKIIDIPAFDSTRAWRDWQADQKQIEKLEEAERAFGLQRKLMQAMVKARLYGGAAIIMGIEGTGKFSEELDIEKVKKDSLKFVHVVERSMITAGPMVRDITSPYFGEPAYYLRSNFPETPVPGNIVEPKKGKDTLGYREDVSIYIHPSRVARIIGLEYPNVELAPDVWGDSALQPVCDAIRDAGMVSQSIAALVSRANVDLIKVPGLTNLLSTQTGTNKLMERFGTANVYKSVINSLLIDKNEDWSQLQVTFSGLPQVHQTFFFIAAGAADIPATRLLGREPAGQNATGESDLRNYYDRISADQNMRLKPLLSRIDEVLLRHVFGTRPKEIYYEWTPLWQMSESEKADVALRKAQAFKIDVDSALMNPEALKKGREAQLIEDGTYPGLEAAIAEAEAAETEESWFSSPTQPASFTAYGGGKPNGGGFGFDSAGGGPRNPGPFRRNVVAFKRRRA